MGRILVTDQRLDWVYSSLFDDEDSRVCRDISDRACTNLPRNAALLVLTNLLTKIGDALASPKTVLAWVVAASGAPEFLIALLVPIRESGSLIPQLLIAGAIRRMPRRRAAWIFGSFLQGCAILAIAFIALTGSGTSAGWAMVGCLAIFSLARGICSISHKDVVGKTIPKTRRGRVSGLSASLSGFAAMIVGFCLIVYRDQLPEDANVGLLVVAGAGWLIAAGIFAFVKEERGETGGGGNAIVEGLRRLSLLWTDPPFRNFCLARSLALCSALTAPYYIVMAQRSGHVTEALLGAFILADGIASTVSSSVWGRFADVSSRRVLSVAVAAASLLGFGLYGLEVSMSPLASETLTYPAAFFLLGIAHSGVRLGRKTYIVDLAGGNKRTDYVAVSNTVIGIILLAAGSIGAVSTFASPGEIVAVLSGLGVIGAVTAWRLPEVQHQ